MPVAATPPAAQQQVEQAQPTGATRPGFEKTPDELAVEILRGQLQGNAAINKGFFYPGMEVTEPMTVGGRTFSPDEIKAYMREMGIPTSVEEGNGGNPRWQFTPPPQAGEGDNGNGNDEWNSGPIPSSGGAPQGAPPGYVPPTGDPTEWGATDGAGSAPGGRPDIWGPGGPPTAGGGSGAPPGTGGGGEPGGFDPTDPGNDQDPTNDPAPDGLESRDLWGQGTKALEAQLDRFRQLSRRGLDEHYASRGLVGSSIEGDGHRELEADINVQAQKGLFDIQAMENDRGFKERYYQLAKSGQSSDEAYRNAKFEYDKKYGDKELGIRERESENDQLRDTMMMIMQSAPWLKDLLKNGKLPGSGDGTGGSAEVDAWEKARQEFIRNGYGTSEDFEAQNPRPGSPAFD